MASVTYAAVASSPDAESASVSSVMKFWFTQPARSRATQRRRRSLSTCSMKRFASSAFGVADTSGGDDVDGGAATSHFGHGTTGAGSGPHAASPGTAARANMHSGAREARRRVGRFTPAVLAHLWGQENPSGHA